ncbi:hypothetical protein [Streptomyces niveus]|uniref:Major facilitator superfamily (MFS) profile domain-containing protein n=1 Tax=Streptomyces niveus TaxID=193462 RepID=A0ABZ2A648_STRNV|nr:hypothetical protein [Streptomyces niveus]
MGGTAGPGRCGRSYRGRTATVRRAAGPQLLIGLGLGIVLTAATSLATAEVGTALFNTVATTATAAYPRDRGTDVTSATVHGFGVGLLVATGIMLLAALVATVLLRPRGTHGA